MGLACRLWRGKRIALFLIALFAWYTSALDGVAAFASPEPAVDVRPLVVADESTFATLLPQDSRLLIRSGPIERFLAELEETIPDWTVLYGRGHHDPELDDRLFQFNRSRDERRRDKAALGWRVTFLWMGRLSQLDPERGGFPVAVGPELVRTGWGMVRFKPADLPNLTAGATASLQERLIRRIENGEAISVSVAMTGHLIAEESVIYDFSHEEEGQGLIMPVVQIERVDYVLVAP
ncbi:MAG: hypothetical protein AB7G68_06395 [Nitrospiraceae bacterium]